MTDKTQILIVEHDVQLADTMALLLGQVGYRILRAQQAGEGLALARQTAPDLLIVDAGFAGLLAGLCDEGALRDTPILILADSGRAPEHPCPPLHAILEKPFKPNQFLAEIEQLLALRASARPMAEATILVVDVDPDFSHIVTRILAANGYHVLTATNGAEAWQQMQEERPDLVLLDVMMSTILDGLGVSQRMGEDPALRDVPILMISSIADTEYAAAFPTDQDVHIEAWISKPVDPESLLEKVRQHLR
ncbi:MAG: response regulator [Anaerolineae bacterium]